MNMSKFPSLLNLGVLIVATLLGQMSVQGVEDPAAQIEEYLNTTKEGKDGQQRATQPWSNLSPEFQNAVALLPALRSDTDTFSEYQYRMVQILLSRDKFSEAVEIQKKIPDYRRLLAILEIAEAAHAFGETELATEMLEKAKQSTRRVNSVHFERILRQTVITLLAMGQLEEADRIAAQIDEKSRYYKEVQSALNRENTPLGEIPEEVDLTSADYVRLARKAQEAEQKELAIIFAEKSLRVMDPEDNWQQVEQLPEVCWLHYELGEKKIAIEGLERVSNMVRSISDHIREKAEILVGIADYWQRMGQTEKAEELVEAAAKAAENQSSKHYRPFGFAAVGRGYWMLGEQDLAIKAWKEALKEAADLPNPRVRAYGAIETLLAMDQVGAAGLEELGHLAKEIQQSL